MLKSLIEPGIYFMFCESLEDPGWFPEELLHASFMNIESYSGYLEVLLFVFSQASGMDIEMSSLQTEISQQQLDMLPLKFMVNPHDIGDPLTFHQVL